MDTHPPSSSSSSTAAAATTLSSPLTAHLAERSGRAREALPNIRGEDETRISYLINLIESLSWILFPSAHPTCVLGRHPRPPEPGFAFCASLYSMGKSAPKYLDVGPETGASRAEALANLLAVVEREIGGMMLRDAKRANAAAAVAEDRAKARGGGG